MTTDRLRWLLLGVAGVLLVVHSLAYNFVTDDAYISFVFSRNFAEHGQLAFNVGQPVEGYTNFLWTLILGLLMIVGISPEVSSRVLSTVCALLTLYLAMRTIDHAVGKKTLWAVIPAFVLATSSGFACWTSGGLETQLFSVLVAGAIEATVAATNDNPARHLRRAAICCALGAMTRPEGVLIFALLGAARVVHVLAVWRRDRKLSIRPELTAVAWFLGVWGPWFLWRYWYYGYWAPNTYYVKAHGPWANPKMADEMRDNGLHYVWVWAQQTKLLWGLPLLILPPLVALSRPLTARGVLVYACTFLSIGYLGYVVTVGGDFMGLHRFIMPVFITVALLVGLGAQVIEAFQNNRAGMILGSLVGAALALGFGISQLHLTQVSRDKKNTKPDRGIDTPGFLMVYTEDRAAIGRAMAPCFHPDDFSIVGGAGAQPYYGRMRAIDVFGLVSEKIAHTEPRVRPRAGHTKFGNDTLLASYDPTFVFSCYDITVKDTQPKLGCAGFWLARGFEEVTIHVPDMQERGTYYTFLAKKSRAFTCPNRVH